MPMVYITKKTEMLLDKILKLLQENVASTPSRLIKADVVHTALEDYAKKLGLK